jgi:hypothetical protein
MRLSFGEINASHVRRKAWLIPGHQPQSGNFKVLEHFCGRQGDLGPGGTVRSGKARETHERQERETKNRGNRGREREEASIYHQINQASHQSINLSPPPRLLLPDPSPSAAYCRYSTAVALEPDYSRAHVFPGDEAARYLQVPTYCTVTNGAPPKSIPNHPAAVARSPSLFPIPRRSRRRCRSGGAVQQV